MSDPQMEAIRQKRMAELSAQHGGRIPSKEEVDAEAGKQRFAASLRSLLAAPGSGGLQKTGGQEQAAHCEALRLSGRTVL